MSEFIPAPEGVFPDDVTDAEKLAEDFLRLHRIASHPTQHQWRSGAFTTENLMKEGHPARLMVTKTEAHLYQASYADAVATIDGDNPVLDAITAAAADVAAVADPALFTVPYNRGLVPVTGTRQEWTTPFPEFVCVWISYQYIRRAQGRWGSDRDTALEVRFKSKIAINGSLQPGTGPEVIPLRSRYRGSGYARRSMRTTVCWMGALPAGTHYAELYAGQGACDSSSDEETVERDSEMQYKAEPPSTGVCVGHRTTIVLRFPFGMTLGG